MLLYEMVTGRRPFAGDTPLRTLSAIVRDTPRRVAEFALECPAELERVIDRCLRKDPERRWQHMQDVRVALMDLKDESDSETRADKTMTAGGKTNARPSDARRRTALVILLIVAAAMAAASYMLVMRRPGKEVIGFVPEVPVPLTAYPGFEPPSRQRLVFFTMRRTPPHRPRFGGCRSAEVSKRESSMA